MGTSNNLTRRLVYEVYSFNLLMIFLGLQKVKNSEHVGSYFKYSVGLDSTLQACFTTKLLFSLLRLVTTGETVMKQ